MNFLLPADEYFIKAGRAVKDEEFYGGFEQIENGIGMTAKFMSEANAALLRIAEETDGNPKKAKPKKTLIISGVSAAEINRELAEKCCALSEGLEVEVLPVVNDFFGSTVTCTGLLTGKDMVKALEEFLKERSADEVIIASNTMKEFEEVFLCGMTLKEFKKALKRYGVKVKVNALGGEGLIKILSENKE